MKRRLFSILMTAAMVLSLLPVVGMAAEAEVPEADVFFDDFNENTLDSSRWLIAHKRWGGDNGGVVKENVSVSDGKLMLEGHGLNYTGDVPGIGREDGKLTGAAIATRDYYASGSYEVVAKIAPELGACSALWTFEYEEYYPGQEGYIPELATWGYCTVNHEIDIEIPTGTNRNPDPNFSSARFNTYLRENDYTPHYHDLGQNLNDGEFHTYRFDWHTGDTNQTARVEFYIDDVLQYTSYTDIPTNEGRFWIGLWFPYSIDSNHDGEEDTGWSGLADFDITFFEIDSVKITPFHEAGDTAQHETYAYDGWAPNSFPELAEQEAYEHIVNGDFAQGSSAWTLEDEAYVAGEKLHLSSGQVRDEAYQLVDVLPAATYTITADVVTDGTEVRIGACKENGGNDQYATVTESGKVSFTFQNDTVNPVLKVYAKVDRWQGSDVQVTVDNISMVGAEYVAQPVTVFVPSEPGQPDPDQPDQPGPGEPETPAEPGTPVNLVVNGTFDDDSAWDLSGSAAVENGAAVLASGQDTDTVDQTVAVEGGKTYTMSVDVTTPGAEITFGVKDQAGRYTEDSQTVTESGTYTLTFTTASHVNQIEVFAKVLRYQDCTADCTIDNVVLVEGTVLPTEPVTPDPEEPTPEVPEVPNEPEPPVAENLLLNPGFASAEGWTLNGSARIENGTAILASGRDTDIASQTLTLEPYTTYTFSADIQTAGTVVDLKVADFNGRYSGTMESFSASGTGSVTFTTGASPSAVKLSLHVLRYQNIDNDCTVTYASLVKES